MSYKDYIDEVPDFPVEGVNFKDLSPLLSDEKLFRTAIIEMGRKVKIPDFWVGIDSRGYVFASALSMMFNSILFFMFLVFSSFFNFPAILYGGLLDVRGFSLIYFELLRFHMRS